MGERLRRRASTRVWMTGKLGFRLVEMYSSSSAPPMACTSQGSKSRPRFGHGRYRTDTRVKMGKNQSQERKYFGFIVEGGVLWESSRESEIRDRREGGGFGCFDLL